MRDDEGDWGQGAISCKEGPTGIWGGRNVCVCVCVYMSDSGLPGHFDCPSPPLLCVTLLLPTVPFFFPISLLYFSLRTMSNSHSHFLTSSSFHSLTISGSSLIQSLLVGLPAHFPLGHHINRILLILTQSDSEGDDQVSFSFPTSLVHVSHAYATLQMLKGRVKSVSLIFIFPLLLWILSAYISGIHGE